MDEPSGLGRPTAGALPRGLGAYPRALSLLRQHARLRRLALAPVAINTVLFAIGGAVFLASYDDIVASATAFLAVDDGTGAWHAILSALSGAASFVVGAVIFVGFLVAIFYGFSLVGNLVAAPFNEAISQLVEQLVLGGAAPGLEGSETGGLAAVYREGRYALGNEVRRLGFYLVIMTPLLLANLTPLAVVAGPAGLIITALFLALEYTDGPMSRRRMPFRDKRALLRRNLVGSLSFGAVALASLAIPFVNLALLPVHVTAGTLLYLAWSGEAGAPGGAPGDSTGPDRGPAPAA